MAANSLSAFIADLVSAHVFVKAILFSQMQAMVQVSLESKERRAGTEEGSGREEDTEAVEELQGERHGCQEGTDVLEALQVINQLHVYYVSYNTFSYVYMCIYMYCCLNALLNVNITVQVLETVWMDSGQKSVLAFSAMLVQNVSINFLWCCIVYIKFFFVFHGYFYYLCLYYSILQPLHFKIYTSKEVEVNILKHIHVQVMIRKAFNLCSL